MPHSQSTTLEEYRALVRQRLAQLNRVFANASVGDFSVQLDLPDDSDEFTELYAGIEIMLDVIREKIADADHLNAELTEHVKQLERINRLMVGREVKMRALKQELATLRAQLASAQPSDHA